MRSKSPAAKSHKFYLFLDSSIMQIIYTWNEFIATPVLAKSKYPALSQKRHIDARGFMYFTGSVK